MGLVDIGKKALQYGTPAGLIYTGGKALVGAVKGHIDDAGKDLPQYDAPALDATTQAMMDEQVDRANLSDKDMLAQKMAGVDSYRPVGSSSAQQNAALGMTQDTTMDQALSKRANAYFDRAQGSVRKKAEGGIAAERFNRRQTALENRMTLDKQEAQIRNRKVQHEANVRAAKNQAVSDVLGIGGTAVGAAAGSFVPGLGPAGGAKIGGSAAGFAGDTQMREVGDG